MLKNKIKILLADDHNIVRKGIKEIINAFEDCEVINDFPDGKQLIAHMEVMAAPYDICILDINMPEMDGYETAKFIKNKWPK